MTNELILTELIPREKIQGRQKIVESLQSIKKAELQIDWEQLIDYQCQCIKHGLNGMPIPDLIIAQNALQNHCKVFTLDRHFVLIQNVLGLALFRG